MYASPVCACLPLVVAESFAELGQGIFQCVHETNDHILFEWKAGIRSITLPATGRVRQRCDDLREARNDDGQEHDAQSNDQQSGDQGQDVNFG